MTTDEHRSDDHRPGDRSSVPALLAVQLAKGPLVAQALAKAAIDDGLQVTLAEGLALEQAAFVEVFRTEDARVGVASFLEHGPGRAEFTGH